MSVGLNCWFQTTCRFCTLFELICVNVEKRELDVSPSAPSQFAPAAVAPFGSQDAVVALGDADASAATVAPRSTVATTRSEYFRMRRLATTSRIRLPATCLLDICPPISRMCDRRAAEECQPRNRG